MYNILWRANLAVHHEPYRLDAAALISQTVIILNAMAERPVMAAKQASPSTLAASPRATLLALFEAAWLTAHPRTCLAAHLPDLPQGGRMIIVGAGKADAAMAVATEAVYFERGQQDRISGFVTTRHGFELPTRKIEIIQAAHPVPDESSILGAKRTLELVATAQPGDIVLALISGGASALWSAPVDGVSFAAKQALTKQLLRSGAPIGEMNIVRKHLSRIKGGKLAAAVPAHARLITLAISDVPGDEPTGIGSGPTVADPSTLADARAVLARYKITPSPEIAAALNLPANETLKPGSPALARTDYRIVAAPKASLEAAAVIARELGYRVEMLGDALEGEARDVGAAHAKLALAAKQRGERVAILSGGEFTVTVTGNGQGGPNQEYALGAAIALNGATGIHLLAADTDGIDGGSGASTDPAGAIVAPDTLLRAKALNLNAATSAANNDSTNFFRPLGDLIQCGPTQTNVNDFRALLVDP
jgi:glycerate 2-kinase